MADCVRTEPIVAALTFTQCFTKLKIKSVIYYCICLKMRKIHDIRNQIILVFSNTLKYRGFDVAHPPTFYYSSNDVIQIVHLGFLTRDQARYFNSNTDSFTIYLGLFYIFITSNPPSSLPKEYECQVRGYVNRNFFQKHPMPMKGYSFFHPERWRRDIWWVEKNGSNLDKVIYNANKLLETKAMKWLNKYSDLQTIYNFLQFRNEKSNGPFGFGTKGSPARKNLIEAIEKRLHKPC